MNTNTHTSICSFKTRMLISTSSTNSMAISHLTKTSQPAPAAAAAPGGGGEEERLSHECKELLLSLPREKGWRTPYIYRFQGFWCQPEEIQAILSFQKHFQGRDSDVILASIPKSGTTWLKALTFAIMNRKRFAISKDHPLLTSNPHDLVPFLEYKLYANNQVPDLLKLPDDQPRVFATHIPFPSLQDSVNETNCRVVYICRNPFDTFISSWIFLSKLRPDNIPPLSLEEGFNMYCKGLIGFGPFWDHMLGYWKESQERPDKVLFLKYEDMKEDITFYLKKLAKFLGCTFSVEEEKDGTIQEIAKLCGFEKMKDLEVNKDGKGAIKNFDNKHLFRKGEVGDWVNYLSPEMVEQLLQVMEEKLGGCGLEFKVYS